MSGGGGQKEMQSNFHCVDILVCAEHFYVPFFFLRPLLLLSICQNDSMREKCTALSVASENVATPTKLFAIRNVWILLVVPRKWKLIMAFSWELNAWPFLFFVPYSELRYAVTNQIHIRIHIHADAKQLLYFSTRIFTYSTPINLAHFSVWITLYHRITPSSTASNINRRVFFRPHSFLYIFCCTVYLNAYKGQHTLQYSLYISVCNGCKRVATFAIYVDIVN